METEAGGSVTGWIGHIKRGDHAAARTLWERYFDRLVRLARGKLAGVRGLAADEEDVALSAFDSFCHAAAAGRFPALDDRDDLWKLLMTLTARKALNLRKHATRIKRGGGRVIDEAALGGLDPVGFTAGLDALAGEMPSPEYAAMVAEEFRLRLEALGAPDLRQVALLKLEGLTHEEIAERLDCTPRTVANKLKLIRTRWERDG